MSEQLFPSATSAIDCRRARSAERIAVAFAPLACWACSANSPGGEPRDRPVDDPSSSGGAGDDDAWAPGDDMASPDREPAADHPPAVPTPSRLWRLTYEQYDNTISALLGKTVHPTRELGFPAEPESSGWTNQANVLEAKEQMASLFARAAALHARALAETLPACAASDGACLQKLLRDFGKRAWRRPLRDEEVQRYRELFDRTTAELDAGAARATVVEAFLRSPHFLFRSEAGDPEAPNGNEVLLTSHELASALSYGLWNGPPDDELMQLADEGRLQDSQTFAGQVNRLLGDARARTVFTDFVEHWVGVHDVADQLKVDPQWSRAAGEAMREEVRRMAQAIFEDEGANMRRLLTAPHGTPSTSLAWVYANETNAGKTSSANRRGVLLSPAFLSKQASQAGTNPSRRGDFVVERIACFKPPPPPATLEVAPPPPDPGKTTRENFEQHRRNPACASCHRFFDPVGMALEAYDVVGRFRTQENGRPIRTDDVLAAGVLAEGEAAFDGPLEMVEKLAASRAVHACMARRAFQYLYGREDGEGDAAVIARALARFVDEAYDWRALTRALLTQRHFVVRKPTLP